MIDDKYQEINDQPGYDDPVWDYFLRSRLQMYIEPARKWWAAITELEPKTTGVYSIKDGPPGFAYRFTRIAARSPIKGIQAFPFVPASYLYLTGVQGGAIRMVERLCRDNTFIVDEFTVVYKGNLPSTYNRGQFLAFIPTALLETTEDLGIWLYLTHKEIRDLADALKSTHLTSIKAKLALKL
jgi:hypothetical protein